MQRNVKVSLSVQFSASCAAHLLWNVLYRNSADAEEATVKLVDKPPTLGAIRDMVKTEIIMHGVDSVCCGPEVDYYDPTVERLILNLVQRAFKF
jgi:hypothetical protein